jgi:phosphoribosylanthranilate isomerase
MLKIKICGVTSVADALAAAEEGADFVGLIFAKSPRRIDAATAREVVRSLPETVTPVGVFMDQPFTEVRATLLQTGLRFAQLHGAESPDFAATLGVHVIKTFTNYTDESLEELRKYDTYAFLLDIPKGATARASVDVHWATCAKKFGRVILSGALTAETVGELVRHVRPFGVDACRATERSPGKKDRGKLHEFVQAVRLADQVTTKIKVKVR